MLHIYVLHCPCNLHILHAYVHTLVHNIVIVTVTVIIVIALHTCKRNGCYKGELPQNFSIKVNMRRVVFYVSFHQLFISLEEEGGKAKWHYIRH